MHLLQSILLLNTELLDAIHLPKTVAICKCAAHTSEQDDISLGHAFADRTAKAAATGEIEVLLLTNQTTVMKMYTKILLPIIRERTLDKKWR